MPVTYRDRDGVALRAGDIVRVVGVPDLRRMHPDARTEIEGVFRHLVGKYKRIDGFEWGEARLDFRIRSEGPGHSHTVWIETHLLKRRAPFRSGKQRSKGKARRRKERECRWP
jgi:hypothetical protein